MARGRVGQARLYYLRDLAGKAARIKERDGSASESHDTPSEIVDQIAAPAAAGGEEKDKIKGKGKRKRQRDAAVAG
jgi:hypothetical protein